MKRRQKILDLSLILFALLLSCGKGEESADKDELGGFRGSEDSQGESAQVLDTLPVESFDVIISGLPEGVNDETPKNIPSSNSGPFNPAPGTGRPEGQAPAPSPNPQTPPTTPSAALYPASCAEIKKAQPAAASGVFKIYLNPGLSTRVGMDAFCEMSEDGGGWTLLLNYVHKAETNPPLSIRSNNLPLMAGDTLGEDESMNPLSWGHVANELAAMLPMKELRFYCRSTASERVVHFKSNDVGCISAVRQGSGTCLGLKDAFAPLKGHTATIPAAIDTASSDRGQLALTDDIFGHEQLGADDMWSVAGDGSAWECDFGSNDEDENTIHRVYFR